jgi:hypothetical protein
MVSTDGWIEKKRKLEKKEERQNLLATRENNGALKRHIASSILHLE